MLFIQAECEAQTGKQYAERRDFFLEHIDHGQEQAVNLAYEFYKLSKADYVCACPLFCRFWRKRWRL